MVKSFDVVDPCGRGRGIARPRAILALAVAAVALLAATVALSRPSRTCAPSTDPVLVPLDAVPPDACVAYYGPGPCREHGQTVQGSTDAVALWPMSKEGQLAAHPRPEPRR